MDPFGEQEGLGWLTARSIARGLPAPVRDSGGWRVDTASAVEERRYVFPYDGPTIARVAERIDRPGILLKLFGIEVELAERVGPRWRITGDTWAMSGPPPAPVRLPDGYDTSEDRTDARIAVRITDADGTLAASGYGAAALGVFAYDRIVVGEGHRRRGLGRALMAAIGAGAPTGHAHLLVATAMGRALYERLGWRVRSGYATAELPPAQLR